jgi:hypothetical protein
LSPQADPTRSVLDLGSLPSGRLTAHREHTLTLQLVDTYGNLLTKGGTLVQVFLLGPNRVNLPAVEVKDGRDGTYAVTVKVSNAGKWAVQVVTNGQVSSAPVADLMAVWGKMLAHEVLLLLLVLLLPLAQ